MKLIASIVGAAAAITYVGFFAYKVNELPLTIIVTVCLALMVYSFIDDMRQDRAADRARRDQR